MSDMNNPTRTLEDFVGGDWQELCQVIKNYLKEKGYGEVEVFTNLECEKVVTATAIDPDDEDNIPVRFCINWDYAGDYAGL